MPPTEQNIGGIWEHVFFSWERGSVVRRTLHRRASHSPEKVGMFLLSTARPNSAQGLGGPTCPGKRVFELCLNHFIVLLFLSHWACENLPKQVQEWVGKLERQCMQRSSKFLPPLQFRHHPIHLPPQSSCYPNPALVTVTWPAAHRQFRVHWVCWDQRRGVWEESDLAPPWFHRMVPLGLLLRTLQPLPYCGALCLR